MSFLSREEFKLLANADLDKLYDYLVIPEEPQFEIKIVNYEP